MVVLCLRIMRSFAYVISTHSMASIKFGSIITEAAGKVGGQILQRGRTGAQMRNLTTPREKRYNDTAARQLPFAITSQLWRTLTPTQTLEWANLALTQTRYNRFGDAYTPSGYQLFCEFNLNLRLVSSVSSVLSAPTLVSLPDVSDFQLNGSTGPDALTLAWTYTSGATAWRVLPFTVSARPVGSTDQYRTAVLYPNPTAVASGTVDLTPVISARLTPGFVAGNFINGGYRLIHSTTGQGSPLYRLTGFIS